jgi:adenine-specific DNA-methyltransferase
MLVSVPPTSCKVYTPLPLAASMVEAIVNGLDQRWLEPSCGKGSFIQAINSYGVPRDRIIGVDLDIQKSSGDRFGRVSRGIDFLTWSLTRKGKFDCVAGNPPYVAIRALPKSLRNIAASILDLDGNAVGTRANIWYPFLLRSVEMLRNGGNLAFVLPAASEYANYASLGRKQLTSLFARVDLIRSRRPLFQDVSEGVVVVIAKGKGLPGRLFRRHEVEDLDSVIQTIRQIDDTKARNCRVSTTRTINHNMIYLRDVIKIQIGAVTGDSGYFVLTENQRLDLKLPKRSVVPILSRCSHVLTAAHNRKSWEKLRDSGERIWLFRPTDNVVENLPVRKYLLLTENDGGCHLNRYKVRNRQPWYLTPLPPTPDLFLTGMSSHGLWMCLNEHPKLTATNTLYVGAFRETLTNNQKYSWALSLLTSQVQKQIGRAKRVYADGLAKFEPSQINGLEIPVPGQIANARSTYRKAVKLFLSGEPTAAAALADSSVYQ